MIDLMRPDPDHARCCICFRLRHITELFTDEDGCRWDLCADAPDGIPCAMQAGLS